MDRKNLEALSKEELIEIIMQQYEQMVIMQAAFEKLRADYEALKMKFEQNQKPPTSSQNSSQPPSRDQKGNASKEKRRHRHGPPKGHEKHERKLIADANHVIEMRAKCCQDCEARLEGEQGQLVKVNQITELPEAKAQVIEVRYYEVNVHVADRNSWRSPRSGWKWDAGSVPGWKQPWCTTGKNSI